MARAPREHLVCPACEWQGTTTLGRVRKGVFRTSTAIIAVLIVLELTGLTELGANLWTTILILAWGSVALRLLIRGDRCPSCGERAIYVKRPPPPVGSEASVGSGGELAGPGEEPPQGDRQGQ